MSSDLELETVRLEGDPKAMGRRFGDGKRAEIRRFVEMRLEAARRYLADRGWRHAPAIDALLALAQQSEGLHRAWDGEGFAEHEAIADASGLSTNRLYAASQMTDMRDALLLAASRGEPLRPQPAEGCTAVLMPPTAGESYVLGQTWDLNPTDVEFVVAVDRRPERGMRTWSVTCVGCLSLVGINEGGVAVGTTNLKTYGSRAGVGYLGLIHRALRAATAEQACAGLRQAPCAAAHSYWMADRGRVVELELSPNGAYERSCTNAPIVRTNHCLAKEHAGLEGEVRNESTLRRYRRAAALAEALPVGDLDGLKVLFSDRQDGVHSINRYPEDRQGTATNAVFVAAPASACAWACRGPADRGRWHELRFSPPKPVH